MIFFLKFIPIYVHLRVIRDFVITVTIMPKIDTTLTRFSKDLAKSVLWSNPHKMKIVQSRAKLYETVDNVQKKKRNQGKIRREKMD